MSQRLGGFVFIIESPSADDLLDGRTEGRTLSEALSLSKTDARYCLVTSRAMFFKALRERLVDALRHFCTKNPIIHFSMHGNHDGVGLTNGDFVSWIEMRAALAPLNNAMNGGLLICMSACFGGAGCRMAMHEDDEQPFWALVGNSASSAWADAAVAYVTFYHQFFKDRSVEAAVHAMRVASGDPNFRHFYGHEVKAGWAQYIDQHRTELPQDFMSALSAVRDPRG